MNTSFSKINRPFRQRRLAFEFLLAALLVYCVTVGLYAAVIVVPNSLATNDGNGTSTSNPGAASVRWLQIHDASQFQALSGPSLLTQFAYRPDTVVGESGPRTLTLRIYASTTSRSVAELSTTFADNLGANNTLVFDGTVIVTTANLPGPGNTRQFDYVFPFTTPFLYDPAAGNLVLDLQIVSSGSALTFDTVSGDSAIGRVFSSGSSTATTGDLRASHVTQLTFAPEPTTVALLGLGAAGFLCRRSARGNQINRAEGVNGRCPICRPPRKTGQSLRASA